MVCAMGIQLVVFDVDGTLLQTGERLADATAERIAALVGTGAQLALASARPTESLRLVRDQIGVPMHLVGFNGAEVLHADDTPVREVGFAIEGCLAAALSNFVAAGGTAINVYCSDGRWLGIGEKELLDREEHDTWTKATKPWSMTAGPRSSSWAPKAHPPSRSYSTPRQSRRWRRTSW